MLIVQKYGGTSVANAERINHVAHRIADAYLAGNQMVVVLSAQGSFTDRLLQKAHELNPHASKRELDMLLTTGEQQSVALMAMALHKLGLPAVSLNAVQIGLATSDHYSDARIKSINTDRIYAELDKGNIVLIAGFQGINSKGDFTTLGRGGSNTTAVAIAAVLKADLCENCTDVDGVYTADPRVVPTAKKLTAITYDEMLEMSCQVFHNRAAEMAKKYNVKLIIRSSMTKEPGTEIKEGGKVEDLYVSGVSIDRDVSQISLHGINSSYSLFTLLAKAEISVDIIVQTPGTVSITMSKQDSEAAFALIQANKEILGYESLTHNPSLAKLTIVGAGMAASPGVAAAFFEVLHENDINVILVSTSEIKISVLIDEHKAETAMQVVHDKFAGLMI